MQLLLQQSQNQPTADPKAAGLPSAVREYHLLIVHRDLFGSYVDGNHHARAGGYFSQARVDQSSTGGIGSVETLR